MENHTIFLAVFTFLITTFLGWKILDSSNRKHLNKSMYTKWKSKWMFWQAVIYSSTGATFLLMYILKWTKVVNF